MKMYDEHSSVRKINKNIINSLCQFTNLPVSDRLYLSRLIRTQYLIKCLLSLESHYDEMVILRDNMFKAGQKSNDSAVIKFSASLNSAIDAISNHQQGRDDLLIRLKITLCDIEQKIKEYRDSHHLDTNRKTSQLSLGKRDSELITPLLMTFHSTKPVEISPRLLTLLPIATRFKNKSNILPANVIFFTINTLINGLCLQAKARALVLAVMLLQKYLRANIGRLSYI